MSVIVISTDSPTFECTSPACYIDAESIDTSYVYDSEYASSCDINDPIYIIGGGSSGTDGTDGTNGVGISFISGPTTIGLVDTYTINYTDASTDTFDVTNGAAGITPAFAVGTVTTGAEGTSVTITDVGTAPDVELNFSIPVGDTGITGDTGTAGSQILQGTNSPIDNNPGVNGDYYLRTNTYDLYYKSTGIWAFLINIKGATGDAGNDGDDGTNGDVWTYGDTVPIDITVNAFNEYYVLTTNKQVYLKVAAATTYTPVFSLNGDTYYSTSTTPVDLGAMIVGNTVELTVDSDLAYSTGQFIVVANSTTEQFTAKITSYSGTTLTAVVTYKIGSSALASWDVNLAGVAEAGSVPQWYTITATAGTGTVASRTYTAPAGWTVATATTVTNTDLPSPTVNDLRIYHNTGLYAVDSIVFVDEGTYNTKATGTRAYGSMYEDEDFTTIHLSSFCTESSALVMHIKLQ
jgi:hypothetical protein